MQFSKSGNIYKVIRITGSLDNILGISFDKMVNTKTSIEVIEWDFPNIKKDKIQTSKEEVLKQVLEGLDSINESLGTNYKLSKIYYSPYDLPYYNIYSTLTSFLIRHYHNGKPFIET